MVTGSGRRNGRAGSRETLCNPGGRIIFFLPSTARKICEATMIRSRSSLRLPPLVLLVASFFACTEPEPSSTYTMRDSAGIKIVESSGPAWGPGEAWRLSQEPVLTIGVEEGGGIRALPGELTP